MGLLLHTKTNAKTVLQNTFHWIAKALLLIIALCSEIVFAYKIEKNIDEIKALTLPGYERVQTWTDLLFSVDVFIVITMGFIAYLVWSFALEGAFMEWNKRNPKKLAAVKIRELGKKINRSKYNISEFNKKVSALKGDLHLLQQKLETLKKRLNLVFFQPVELEERLETFFGGWLTYVNNHKDLTEHVSQHQGVFIGVKEKLLNNDTENLMPDNR